MKKPTLPAVFFLLALLIQCLTMGYIVFFRFYPVIVFTIALVALFSPRKIEINRDNHLRLIFGLLIAFLFKAFVISRNDFANITAMVPYGYSYSIAQFAILLQAIYFFIKTPEREFPPAMTLLGAITIMSLANQYGGERTHLVIRSASIAFVACTIPAIAILYAREHHARSPRPVLLTTIIILTCALAYAGSLLAAEFESFITNTLLQIRPTTKFSKSQAGFSNNPWIGSIRQWKTKDDQQIALKIVSEKTPGYMRGMTFDYLAAEHFNIWKNRLQMENISPIKLSAIKLPGPATQQNTFIAQPQSSIETLKQTPMDQWNRMDVKIMQTVGDAIFTTIDTQIIQADVDFIKRSSSAITQSIARPSGEQYTIFANGKTIKESLSEAQKNRYLNIPANINPRVRDIATSACLGADTNRQKMEAVARYFRTNYLYHLGIVYDKAPDDRELLNYFLLEKPPAHCEYFASGAAVLLRLQGVPCRYVSGFVATEASPFNTFFVARNKDAHAWVEAWDDQTQQWLIVEATPSQGVPGSIPNDQNSLNTYWEELKTLIANFIRSFKWSNLKNTFLNIIETIAHAIKSPTFYLKVIPIALAIAALTLYIKRRRLTRKHHDPAILAAARLLQRMDARLEKHGLSRQPHETLRQFTHRISQSDQSQKLQPAIRWYQTYAHLRYSGKLNMETINEL